MMSMITINLRQMNDKVKEDEMIKACSAHGREEDCIDGCFDWKTRGKETTRKTQTWAEG
jgi:hypothetical protein